METKVVDATKKQAAESINRVMSRFPLLIEILDELAKSPIPAIGDDELRRGCERACTTMLLELAKIPAAVEGEAATAEELAESWLSGDAVARLIDPTQLERMHQLIVRIIGNANA